MPIGLTVVLGVVAMAIFQGILWTFIVRVRRRRRADERAAIDAELAASAKRGERLVCGPTVGRLRRGHGQVNATFALTNERLLIRPGQSEIKLTDVVAVRSTGSFNSEIRAGWHYVILELGGSEVGLQVRNEESEAWGSALKNALGSRAAAST